jgi:hypothetical protein
LKIFSIQSPKLRHREKDIRPDEAISHEKEDCFVAKSAPALAGGAKESDPRNDM